MIKCRDKRGVSSFTGLNYWTSAMLACMLAMKRPAVKVDLLKLLVANTKLSIAFPIIDVIGYCVAF